MGARRFFIFPMSDCYTYITQYGAIIFLVLSISARWTKTFRNGKQRNPFWYFNINLRFLYFLKHPFRCWRPPASRRDVSCVTTCVIKSEKKWFFNIIIICKKNITRESRLRTARVSHCTHTFSRYSIYTYNTDNTVLDLLTIIIYKIILSSRTH